MIVIKDKSKCAGCTACASICPQHCISMVEDEESFVFPKVDIEKCIHCDRCDKVCPYNTFVSSKDKKETAFVLRSNDKDYLMNGTSGGFVGSLVDYIIDNDGVCCASSMDDNMEVCHVFINSKSEWLLNKSRIQGSKYVQSDLHECFTRIRDYLCAGRNVLFIGTPCQVNGIRNFLDDVDIRRLILVDIVCHGVPSHSLWDRYKEYQEKKHGSRIVAARFRKKTYGYNGSTMSLEFENGSHYDGFLRTDLMLKAYYGNISSRYSCYSCPAKGDRRSADFTIFDAWHARQLASELVDDNLGYTNVIVRSLKASRIWDEIKESFTYFQINPEDAVSKDGVMYGKNACPDKNRELFYKALTESGLSNAMKKLMPVTITDRIRVKIRKTMLLKNRIA